MSIKSKICSKKGYIFTYEAVAVVIIFVAVFYMGYFTFTHVNLTNQEQRHDLERFDKANLISDMLFKDYLFPSENYKPDYRNFLMDVSFRHYGTEKIPGTFDPLLAYTKTEVLDYDIEVSDEEFDVKTIDPNNVSDNIANQNPNYTLSNIYVKEKKLYVPTLLFNLTANQTSQRISEGEIFYFAINGSSSVDSINVSALENTNATFFVNKVPYRLSLGTTEKVSEFEKVLNTYNETSFNSNEIRLLDIQNSNVNEVNITIYLNDTSTIYILKMNPYNVTLKLDMAQ